MAVGKDLYVYDTSIQLDFYGFEPMPFGRYVQYEMYDYATGKWSVKGKATLYANISTSCSYTFYGLTPNTTYRYRGALYDEDGNFYNYYPSYGNYYYEETTHYPMTDYGSAKVDNITPTSVDVILSSITSRNYARTVEFYWRNTVTGASGAPTKTLDAYDTSIDRNMPNLTTGYKYEFIVRVYNPNGDLTWESPKLYATPTAYNYSLWITYAVNATTISVTVTVNEVQDFDILLTGYLDDARNLDFDIDAGKLSRTRTWGTETKLIPATEYKVTIKDQLRSMSWDKYVRTNNNFAWSSVVKAGEPFAITADEWNDYTSQLKAKAAYYGVSYNPATVKTGDELTASKMNNIAAVVNAIVDGGQAGCTTKLAHVDPGDAVTAKKIQALADCLNE